jgi:hypothetical protein
LDEKWKIATIEILYIFNFAQISKLQAFEDAGSRELK